VDLFAVAERMGEADTFANAYESSSLHEVRPRPAPRRPARRLAVPWAAAEP
jgi:hypothetical protein